LPDKAIDLIDEAVQWLDQKLILFQQNLML
jgi:ATP-dependent Clp protease ATP-binding subunit ClpA